MNQRARVIVVVSIITFIGGCHSGQFRGSVSPNMEATRCCDETVWRSQGDPGIDGVLQCGEDDRVVLLASYTSGGDFTFIIRNTGGCNVQFREAGGVRPSDLATIPPNPQPLRVRVQLQGALIYRPGTVEDSPIVRPSYLTAECEGDGNSKCEYEVTDLELN